MRSGRAAEGDSVTFFPLRPGVGSFYFVAQGKIINVFRAFKIELFHQAAFIGADRFITDHHFPGDIDNPVSFLPENAEPAVPYPTDWQYSLCHPAEYPLRQSGGQRLIGKKP